MEGANRLSTVAKIKVFPAIHCIHPEGDPAKDQLLQKTIQSSCRVHKMLIDCQIHRNINFESLPFYAPKDLANITQKHAYCSLQLFSMMAKRAAKYGDLKLIAVAASSQRNGDFMESFKIVKLKQELSMNSIIVGITDDNLRRDILRQLLQLNALTNEYQIGMEQVNPLLESELCNLLQLCNYKDPVELIKKITQMTLIQGGSCGPYDDMVYKSAKSTSAEQLYDDMVYRCAKIKMALPLVSGVLAEGIYKEKIYQTIEVFNSIKKDDFVCGLTNKLGKSHDLHYGWDLECVVGEVFEENLGQGTNYSAARDDAESRDVAIDGLSDLLGVTAMDVETHGILESSSNYGAVSGRAAIVDSDQLTATYTMQGIASSSSGHGAASGRAAIVDSDQLTVTDVLTTVKNVPLVSVILPTDTHLSLHTADVQTAVAVKRKGTDGNEANVKKQKLTEDSLHSYKGADASAASTSKGHGSFTMGL